MLEWPGSIVGRIELILDGFGAAVVDELNPFFSVVREKAAPRVSWPGYWLTFDVDLSISCESEFRKNAKGNKLL